jgi:hypothetical protein
MFVDLLMQNTSINHEFTFDWFQDENSDEAELAVEDLKDNLSISAI